MASRIRQFLLSKPVANTGSQLRDHQANERTFLSWTRMGLAFAAMALALGRLGLIDQVFNAHLHSSNRSNALESSKSTESGNGRNNKDLSHTDKHELLASQACWTISVWSFGYGIFRYVSVHRNLLQGRFVPAVWGPVLMTCGSLGSLGVIFQMDRGVLNPSSRRGD